MSQRDDMLRYARQCADIDPADPLWAELVEILTAKGFHLVKCSACEGLEAERDRLREALAECEGALDYAAEMQESAGNTYGAKKCRERLEHNRALLANTPTTTESETTDDQAD